jgi:biopolymer transport protein ExbB/TolQ
MAWAINEGHIADEMVLRYLTGHAVSKVTVGMFFVGAASLLLIAYNIFEQFSAEKSIRLSDLDSSELDSAISRKNEAIRGFEEEADRAVEHGEQLLEMPAWTQTHYLWTRLVQTLHYIYRTGSVSGVEDEMKYLAELDLDRSHQRYSLARILIWATPMLGFLGTVLGISQALGGISPGPENDFQAMMTGLQSNLYVAFDTTALALTLSMVLMFGQFLVERFEIQLLQLVDQRNRREISDQYDMTMASAANGSFDKIGREVLEATRDVVTNQTEIWKKTIQSAEQAWAASLTQTSDVVRGGLSEALEENVANLADYLGQAIDKANQSTVFRWEQWQTMLSRNARLMKEHQDQMIEQTKNVHSLVGKMDDSSSFNEALVQQKAAIKATTDMHEVLAKVAREITAQGSQLKKQTAVQAEIVKQSAELIEKSSEAYETQKDRQRKPRDRSLTTVPLNKASSKISTAETKALNAFAKLNQSGSNFSVKPAKEVAAPEATAEEVIPAKRRRDPNKPVMFMRSEDVTAIRNKTAAREVVTPEPTADSVPVQEPQDVLKMPSGGKGKSRRRSRPAPMMIKPRKRLFHAKQPAVKTTESSEPKARISVDELKQILKENASKTTEAVVMPDAKTMEERARFRENQRISDAAENQSASRSKRAA